VFDLIELFTHWHAGRSRRQLAQSLGIDRKPIAKYLAPAIAESLIPGGEQITEAAWAAHVARWVPEVTDRSLRATTCPGIEAHRERIRGWLRAEASGATAAQRLRDVHGRFGVGIVGAAVDFGQPVGGGGPVEGDRGAGRWRRGAKRRSTRRARDVVRSGQWSTRRGVGVRDGAGVLAAHVRATSPQDAPILLVRLARGGIRVLRRGPSQADPGQLEGRCEQAGPV
jgi:hypothetical protein